MSYKIEEIVKTLAESFSQRDLNQDELDQLLETYVDQIKESIKNLNNDKYDPNSPLVLWRPEAHFSYDPATKETSIDPMELINQIALHKALKELQDEEGYEVAHLIEEDSEDLENLINYIRDQKNYGGVYYTYVLDWMDRSGITPIAADDVQETRLFDEDGNLIADNELYKTQYINDTKPSSVKERTIGVYNKAEEVALSMDPNNKGKQIIIVTIGEDHTDYTHFSRVEEKIKEDYWKENGYEEKLKLALNGKNANFALSDKKYKQNKEKVDNINTEFERDFSGTYTAEHFILYPNFSLLDNYSSDKKLFKQTKKNVENFVQQKNTTPENIVERTF